MNGLLLVVVQWITVLLFHAVRISPSSPSSCPCPSPCPLPSVPRPPLPHHHVCGPHGIALCPALRRPPWLRRPVNQGCLCCTPPGLNHPIIEQLPKGTLDDFVSNLEIKWAEIEQLLVEIHSPVSSSEMPPPPSVGHKSRQWCSCSLGRVGPPPF